MNAGFKLLSQLLFFYSSYSYVTFPHSDISWLSHFMKRTSFFLPFNSQCKHRSFGSAGQVGSQNKTSTECMHVGPLLKKKALNNIKTKV